jgi:hypothetical protein
MVKQASPSSGAESRNPQISQRLTWWCFSTQRPKPCVNSRSAVALSQMPESCTRRLAVIDEPENKIRMFGSLFLRERYEPSASPVIDRVDLTAIICLFLQKIVSGRGNCWCAEFRLHTNSSGLLLGLSSGCWANQETNVMCERSWAARVDFHYWRSGILEGLDGGGGVYGTVGDPPLGGDGPDWC